MITERKLSNGASILLLFLSSNHGEIQISEKELAEILVLSVRTVVRAKQELIREGIITFKRKGYGRAGVYTVINLQTVQQKEKEASKLKKKNSAQDRLPENSQINISKLAGIHLDDQPQAKPSIEPEYSPDGILIPSWNEFIEFAESLEDYEEKMDSFLREKYDSWKTNGWRSQATDRPLSKWQGTLKQIVKNFKTITVAPVEKLALPKIKPLQLQS